MYYCTNCNDAVEPRWNWEWIQADEGYHVPTCPRCGRSLHVEADYCPICGEAKPKFWSECLNCRAIIGVGIENIIKDLAPTEAAWDAVAEVFSDRYDEAIEGFRRGRK